MARLSTQAKIVAKPEEQSATMEERYAEIEDRMKAWEGDSGPNTGAKDILLSWLLARRCRERFWLKWKITERDESYDSFIFSMLAHRESIPTQSAIVVE